MAFEESRLGVCCSGPLTRCFGSAAFTDRLELEYRRWIRAQHSLRVKYCDIDNFKSINDNFDLRGRQS
ncbi:GGDEF domain-containing protein [Vibrio chagasii]|nr:GGDEF domain-containing protein [Vibrio chagasii]